MAAGSDTFFGGVSSLSEQLDKVVLLVLRDGRHLVGTLASYDQFGSLVLEKSRERHFAGGKFCDVDMGVYLVRGENIALLGELDAAKESGGALVRGDWDEVRALEEKEQERLRAAAAAGGSADLSRDWGMGE